MLLGAMYLLHVKFTDIDSPPLFILSNDGHTPVVDIAKRIFTRYYY
jgi:hypothetical protein